MIIFDEQLRLFATTDKDKDKQGPPKGKQVATLSLSIPIRKFRIDKKGRRRRLATKFSIPLTSGQGAMTGRALRKQASSDLVNADGGPINSRRYRKIVEAFISK